MRYFLLLLLLTGPVLASDEVELTTPACVDPTLTKPDVVAILDITSSKARFFVVDLAEQPNVLDPFTSALQATCALPTRKFQSVFDTITTLETTKELVGRTDVRLFRGLNAVIRFYVFYRPPADAKPTDPPPFKLLVDEEARPTEFMRGLKILLEQAARIKSPEFQLAQGDYRIQHTRSVITVKLRAAPADTQKEAEVQNNKPAAPAVAATGDDPAKADPTKDKQTGTNERKDAKAADEPKDVTIAKITTGKPEHVMWFAAVPVSSAKIVKYDTATNTIAPKEAPKELLVGLAYQFGDVLRTDYPTFSWSRTFVQGLFKFSTKPGDTLGLTVGYRFAPVNVWAGPIWMTEDKVTQPAATGTGGDVVRDEHTKLLWRVGIGVDIGSIVGWIKDAADNEKTDDAKEEKE